MQSTIGSLKITLEAYKIWDLSKREWLGRSKKALQKLKGETQPSQWEQYLLKQQNREKKARGRNFPEDKVTGAFKTNCKWIVGIKGHRRLGRLAIMGTFCIFQKENTEYFPAFYWKKKQEGMNKNM